MLFIFPCSHYLLYASMVRKPWIRSVAYAHLAVALELVVQLREVVACKVVVLALSAVALLELLAHKACLDRLDPLVTHDTLAVLLVRC